MTFAEKLNSILRIANISSSELARALEVDRSTVSRFRTGARSIPKPGVVQSIAKRIAAGCSGSYQLTAVAELTGSPLPAQSVTPDQLAEVIFTWLTAQKDAPEYRVGRLLGSIQHYDNAQDASVETQISVMQTLPDGGLSVYFGNEGKRQAVRQLIECVRRQDESSELCLFTDENLSWLEEDTAFQRELQGAMRIFSQKGWTCRRVQPPAHLLEYSLNSIERWLPLYMDGAVAQYFYPYARDNLHRRTLFLVSGKMALFSTSVAGTEEDPMVFVTTDSAVVAHCESEFDALLTRCRRTMIRHTQENIQELFDLLVRFDAIAANGVYKFAGLSMLDIPSSIIERMGAESSFVSAVIPESLRKRARARSQVLKNRVISDIMYLCPVSQVMAGQVRIPGTSLLPGGPLYYTPREYAAHIEQILCDVKENLNYRAILMDDPIWNNIIIYCKEGAQTLLVRDAETVTIFEITEQTMSDAFGDYLFRMAENQMRIGARQATITRLSEELSRLRTLMR